MSKPQYPLGHGNFVWLGQNQEPGGFSVRCDTLTILKNGIKGDMYRGMWRKVSGHDKDYVATDSIDKGDWVLNLRQITIVEETEVRVASELAGVSIGCGMLRENFVVSFTPVDGKRKFSKLPPLSRMIIGHEDPKVLILTEKNGPCQTISMPIIAHHQVNQAMDDVLRTALKDRRGQMAMVRSFNRRDLRIGDSFTIFPPLS